MSRTAIAVIGATIAATSVGVIALSGEASDASARTHVRHFDAQATSQLKTGSTSFVLAEQDVAGSKVIGHDVLFCRATRTHSTCHLAFAENGGLLYARFTLRDFDRTLRGTVTGGTGSYKHAHGTITGRALSSSDVRVSLSYQV